MIKRHLTNYIIDDLKDKMVFIGGPRQVGKTTLAKYIAAKNFSEHSQYLNWDYMPHRKVINSMQFNSDLQLLTFDEIHKYKNWKNYLKGLFDARGDELEILVTGSARLNLYRKGGDSLLGRYYNFCLHPFSLSEYLGKIPEINIGKAIEFNNATSETWDAFQTLLAFGGFPEPLIKQSTRSWRRWLNERVDRLVKEDIRDTENIRDISSVQLLVNILPEKVGSLLSLNSLREDINVTHKTISAWVDILEHFYYHFRIYPYTATQIKSLRKEPKLYLWDWSELHSNPAARFENMIASHLLKLCHYLNNVEGYKAKLFFWRDFQGREVDFIVVVDNHPWFAVEVKSSASKISKQLSYLRQRTEIPFSYQVVAEKNVDFEANGIRVISADKFLTGII